MSLSFYEMVECTMLSLLPKLLCERLTDLTPGELTRRGIDLLLMDFDNTMLPYTTDQPAPELLRWLEQMQAGGVRLCIVSNSRKLHRVPVFSEKYDIPCVMRAKKPFLRGIREAMTRFGASRAQTALVGDQTYTDVLGANLAGIMSIQVRSICNHTIWLKLRHLLELPPLAFAKNRRIRHDNS